MATRKKYDRSLPGTRELVDKIHHGIFMDEGSMVAFPMCFPGATTPIPADESRITALCTGPHHMVYGGTSGRAAHIFVGMFHGVTGCVVDLGMPPDARETVAVCCIKDDWVAACNGPAGGRLFRGACQAVPFDLIQEWSFSLPPPELVGVPVKGERIVHAVPEPGGEGFLITTASRLVRWSGAGADFGVIADLAAGQRMVAVPAGKVLGLADGKTIWSWTTSTKRFEKSAVVLPEAVNTGAGIRWAADRAGEVVYLADSAGSLFAVNTAAKSSKRVGSAPLKPVTSLAATIDGRVFGTCGEGMEHFFSFNPSSGDLRDIGMAVSIFERRRYGYAFGDAVTGRDGQIYFGENDDLGHLWIYFPALLPRK